MLNTKTLRYIIFALFTLALAVSPVITNMVLNEIKIHGPIYESIISDKDLIADILPPPVYVIESYLEATKLMAASEGATKMVATDAAVNRLAELQAQYKDRLAVWAADPHLSAETKSLLAKDSNEQVVAFYDAVEKDLLPALRASNPADAAAAFATVSAAYEAHRVVINNIVAKALADLPIEEAAVVAAVSNSLWRVAAASAILVLLANAVIWYFARLTFGPLDRITENLASGAEHSSVAADQVAQASQQLAEGASEAAAAVEETSSSLEQMSSMLQSTANNTVKAKALVSEAHMAAQNGSATMSEMTTAMQSIAQSSAEVAKIVKSIDEIAFQTNILALNAAIEAARAGEAGAGFAVVADEVRSLAQRSSAAAHETAEKIEAAILNSRNGSQSLVKLGESFAAIAEKVNQTDSLVNEIAEAAKEQSQGVGQISVAIVQMGKVSARNAGNAETTAGAAEELSAQAKQQMSLAEELRGVTGSAAAPARRLRSAGADAAHAEWQSPRQLKDQQQPARKALALKDSDADKHFKDQ